MREETDLKRKPKYNEESSESDSTEDSEEERAKKEKGKAGKSDRNDDDIEITRFDERGMGPTGGSFAKSMYNPNSLDWTQPTAGDSNACSPRVASFSHPSDFRIQDEREEHTRPVSAGLCPRNRLSSRHSTIPTRV